MPEKPEPELDLSDALDDDYFEQDDDRAIPQRTQSRPERFDIDLDDDEPQRPARLSANFDDDDELEIADDEPPFDSPASASSAPQPSVPRSTRSAVLAIQLGAQTSCAACRGLA